ncbi:hypothetical protein NHX12_026001 [Muraenolepis orangiensis]|uniref:Uncharacterized protein n=1 Tax=Muraenolepis orangiensis TaxID=630683 RepID=A0A9Q0EFQ5_9TELE|nr:hypothetical protein NHX12_026001 [Muraenolepis orangiensis]
MRLPRGFTGDRAGTRRRGRGVAEASETPRCTTRPSVKECGETPSLSRWASLSSGGEDSVHTWQEVITRFQKPTRKL